MQKIAEAYTDISNEYIVGGFDEILQISLSNICENDEEVNGKQIKLDALKRKSSQDVRATVQEVRFWETNLICALGRLMHYG